MSELLNELKHWRVEGGSVLRDYYDYDHWVHWDDIKDIVNKHEKQPTLNENQQIVLEWLKKENFDSYIKSILSNLYFYVNMTAIGDLENEEIQEMVNAYEKLSQEDFAKVLQAFSTWVLSEESL